MTMRRNQVIEKSARESIDRMLWRVCMVSSILACIAAVLLIQDYHLSRFIDPLQPHLLRAYTAKLAVNPADEATQVELRQMDKQLRTLYFRHLRFRADGFKLLLIFAAVAVAAGVFRWHYRPPVREQILPLTTDTVFWATKRASAAAIGIGVILVSMLVWFVRYQSVSFPPFMSEEKGLSTGTSPVSPPVAAFTSARLRQGWPQFRGYDSSGAPAGTNYPLRWDGATAINIAWRAPLSLPGNSSPIVWRDRVYLTAADSSRCALFCYAVADGSVLWSNVWHTARPSDETHTIMEDTGYAASTPVTDGRTVCAIYANGDLAGFDLDGRRKWIQHLGPLNNMYGYAASPAILSDGTLIVQLDQGTDAGDGLSKLMLIDGATGAIRHSVPRSVPNSWASPIVIRDGPTNYVVTAANPLVIAYDAATGAEMWRADCLTGDVAPTPVFHCGMVYTVNAGAVLSAILLGGTGDVTQTHIKWKADENLPDICSPLALDGRIYLLTTFGMLTCYSATEGQKLWNVDLNRTFHASPSAVGHRLLLTSADGTTIVAEGGASYRELWKSELDDTVNASLAFADGAVFIRGKKFMWCIREKSP